MRPFKTRILGIETSCDETSAAVLGIEGVPGIEGDRRLECSILGHVILSQDVHALYGGVVPELAARAHLRVLDDVVDEALQHAGCELADLDAIGVTAGPGLIGALLVGVSWAKGVAHALDLPLVAVHHMEAHLFAPSIENPDAHPPFVALLVSGGHTLLLHVPEWGSYRLLGETRDDAAGEAFDKVGKVLGLPYPGGPHLDRLAREGDSARHPFPRPMLRRNQQPEDEDFFDFSFSGLKTAVATRVAELDGSGKLDEERAHLAAGFQAAAVGVLVEKTLRAVEETGCRRVLLGGGVSANSRLREELAGRLGEDGILFYSTPRLAVDNGAMVARAAAFRLAQGERAGLDLNADAGLPFPGLIRDRTSSIAGRG